MTYLKCGIQNMDLSDEMWIHFLKENNKKINCLYVNQGESKGEYTHKCHMKEINKL